MFLFLGFFVRGFVYKKKKKKKKKKLQEEVKKQETQVKSGLKFKTTYPPSPENGKIKREGGGCFHLPPYQRTYTPQEEEEAEYSTEYEEDDTSEDDESYVPQRKWYRSDDPDYVLPTLRCK
jgi:hypothetical protein